MSGRGLLSAVAVLIAACALIAIAIPSAASGKVRKSPKLAVVYGISGERTVHVSGFARGVPKGYRVRLVARKGKKVRTLRSTRVRRGGRFALKWHYSRRTARATLRVTISKTRKAKKPVAAGSWRTLRLKGIPRAAKRARIKASRIVSLPSGDSGGRLVVSGRSGAKPGQVIVLGVSKQTPGGLLLRITGVSRQAGNTVFATVPGTLPEVIPVGSMDISLPSASSARTARLSSKKDKAVRCSGGVAMGASADAELNSSTKLDASWSPWDGVWAKFEGTAGAKAKLEADISGAAECKFDAFGIFPGGIPLGTYRFTVMGVPIVLTPEGQVYLWGHAKASAAMKTTATASISASAGVEYADGKFKPFGSLTPKSSYSPPQVTASGEAAVYAAPAVFVKVNGIGGPEMDLTTGLELKANMDANPWWTLTAPFSLGVKLKADVWKLHAESGRFEVYNRPRQLASSGGPIARPTPPPPPGPLTRARLTWDTPTDVDLHVWDEEGNHAYYSDQEGISGARLVEDVIPGYGPEYFEETGLRGRRLTYGICQFNGDGATATLTVTDPNGAQRSIDQTLYYDDDYALITTSPDGAGYTPSGDWCDG